MPGLSPSNKGEGSDCNYRAISLLSIVGKLYTCVVLVSLQKFVDQIYPEFHCGFPADPSTVDMIFSLSQHQEKCREQHKPLYIAFIGLTKAFDLVSGEGQFDILPKLSKTPQPHQILSKQHEGNGPIRTQ